MATYSVKSTPTDNSDGLCSSMGFTVKYNGKDLEVWVLDVDEPDTHDEPTPSSECGGMANFIHDMLSGQNF